MPLAGRAGTGWARAFITARPRRMSRPEAAANRAGPEAVLETVRRAARRHRFVGDLERLLPPPIRLPRPRLAPTEWQGGPNLWLIDLVCPFGGIKEAAQQLREQTLKGRAVKAVRAKAEDVGFEVGEWGG